MDKERMDTAQLRMMPPAAEEVSPISNEQP
jgi:hypothetical protein